MCRNVPDPGRRPIRIAYARRKDILAVQRDGNGVDVLASGKNGDSFPRSEDPKDARRLQPPPPKGSSHSFHSAQCHSASVLCHRKVSMLCARTNSPPNARLCASTRYPTQSQRHHWSLVRLRPGSATALIYKPSAGREQRVTTVRADMTNLGKIRCVPNLNFLFVPVPSIGGRHRKRKLGMTSARGKIFETTAATSIPRQKNAAA